MVHLSVRVSKINNYLCGRTTRPEFNNETIHKFKLI